MLLLGQGLVSSVNPVCMLAAGSSWASSQAADWDETRRARRRKRETGRKQKQSDTSQRLACSLYAAHMPLSGGRHRGQRLLSPLTRRRGRG